MLTLLITIKENVSIQTKKKILEILMLKRNPINNAGSLSCLVKKKERDFTKKSPLKRKVMFYFSKGKIINWVSFLFPK